MKIRCLKLFSMLSLCLVMALGVSAQWRRNYSQTRFGITGGFNLADLNYTGGAMDNGAHIKAWPIPSFHVGVLMDYQVTNWMALEPQLLVSGKGASFKIKGQNGKSTYKMRPWYLELPVDLIFRSRLGYNSNLYFGGGPYVALALGGRGTDKGTTINNNPYFSDHKLKFGNGAQKDLKAGDFGFNFKAGIEFNRNLRIGAKYGLGLTNIAPKRNEEAPDVLKNRDLSITLTILFGRGYRPYY